MSYLLDTNVVSETRRRRGNPNVHTWLETVQGMDLYLSVLVFGEIRQGIERCRRRDPVQAAILEGWFASLLADYADRVLPVTLEIAGEWGRMNIPNPVAPIDGLMAATARVHGLTVVTRNVADFATTGVPILNPFEPIAR